MQPLAVKGCTLQLSAGQGKIDITSQPSTKVKCDGKEAYFDKIEFSISNYLGTNITNGDGQATGSISGGSKKIKIEGKAAVLQNDESVTIIVNGTKPVGQNPKFPTTDSITVKVSDAGQTKVKGE